MEEIHWERMLEEALERGAGYLGGTMSSHQNEYRAFSTPGGPLKATHVQARPRLLLRSREEGAMLFKPLARATALCDPRSCSGPPHPSHRSRMTAECSGARWHAERGWILVEGGGGHGGLKKRLLPELTGPKTDAVEVFLHALALQEVTQPDAWMQDVWSAFSVKRSEC